MASNMCDAEVLIFVIGAPGSGKGTQCKRLAAEFDLCHVSVGNMLRELCTANDITPPPAVKDCLMAGRLLPGETLTTLLEERMRKQDMTGLKGFLIDGFPRNLEQADAYEEKMRKPDLVLSFDCPKEIAEKRFLTRKLEGRLNDDILLFDHRYHEFTVQNPAIISRYVLEGKVIRIDVNRSIEETYYSLCNIMRVFLRDRAGC